MIRRFKVIGLGGIGSYLVEPLCRYLNYNAKPRDSVVEVTLVDGDDYEESNRKRQRFDVCENKAQVTASRLRDEFSNLHIRYKPQYVTNDNVVSLIRNDDVIFLCVDNHATRKLVTERCQDLDTVTLISGGNDLTDGNVFYYRREDGRDVTRPPTVIDPRIANPDDHVPGSDHRLGCEERAEVDTQLLFTNLRAASQMTGVFLAHEYGKANFEQVFFDIITQRSRPSPESY